MPVQGASHWHRYAPCTRKDLRDFRTASDHWDEVPLREALGFHIEFNGFNRVLEFLLWILGWIFVVYGRHGSPLLSDGVRCRCDSGFVRFITTLRRLLVSLKLNLLRDCRVFPLRAGL